MTDLAVSLDHIAIPRRNQHHETGLRQSFLDGCPSHFPRGFRPVIGLARYRVLVQQRRVSLEISRRKPFLRLKLLDIAAHVVVFQPRELLTFDDALTFVGIELNNARARSGGNRHHHRGLHRAASINGGDRMADPRMHDIDRSGRHPNYQYRRSNNDGGNGGADKDRSSFHSSRCHRSEFEIHFRHNAAERPDLYQRSGNNDDRNDGKTCELLRNTAQQQTGEPSAPTLSDDNHIGRFPGNRLKE